MALARFQATVMLLLVALACSTGAWAENGFLVRFWYGADFDKEEPAAEAVVPTIATSIRLPPGGMAPGGETGAATLPPGLDLQTLGRFGNTACAEYTATLRLPEAGKYVLACYAPTGDAGFGNHSRAGVRVWLDGRAVIDAWAPAQYSGESKVTYEARLPGGEHDLKVRALFSLAPMGLGFRSLYLAWQPEGAEFEFIPEEYLTPVEPEAPAIVEQFRDILNRATENNDIKALMKDLEAFLPVLERYTKAH